MQELDDVYHDVSSVVADTMIQGADVMALKVKLPILAATFYFYLMNAPVYVDIDQGIH